MVQICVLTNVKYVVIARNDEVITMPVQIMTVHINRKFWHNGHNSMD